ncbi:hypothetical protein E3N88_18535 [Mikania micrantha]|uniref:Uncharacterized protein n=1 Tax=Mikania micrantha TaxID=192012 RepID=A0A5N6NM37_9ASTR|nr:hypothetical protein E3N88_18535 [Mikania micrantha]
MASCCSDIHPSRLVVGFDGHASRLLVSTIPNVGNKEDHHIAGRKKAPAIARPFPGKKSRSRNRPNGLTETDQFSPGKKEDQRL